MAKTFYTERDIADLADRGVTSLEVTDDVVLTNLAEDMAIRRGIRLLRTSGAHPEDGDRAELIHRVKAAVIARLDGQVDEAMLHAIVTRVIQGQ